jgi:hypothetical protein
MNTQRIVKRIAIYTIGLGIFILGYTIIYGSYWSLSQSKPESKPKGIASISFLQENYDAWAKSYSEKLPSGPVLSLLWTKGLSSEYSAAKGIAQFNLDKNTISVRVKGLQDNIVSDVWIVDNVSGAGKTVYPEFGDNMTKIGSLEFDGEKAWLNATVDDLANVTVDMIVVTRQGDSPDKNGVLFGTTSLFQKMYHYPEREKELELTSSRVPSFIGAAHATGITPPNFYNGIDSDLINKGRDLFFNETFNGNGRTCGTCHKEDDNMALGIKTIAQLPDSDPLFIVEHQRRADGSINPLYNDFRMEKPELMRKLGLIFENLNGFKELDGSYTTRGAMRAPSHVLSVRTTLAPPPAVEFDDGTLPLDADDLVFEERTGWSGDGTPTSYHADFFESNGRELTGSLRDFVIGGIIQHFPLTLERSGRTVDQNGNPRQADFRFATEDELDALEAFMLSIGRQTENDDLDTITLADQIADRGRLNYKGFNVFDPDKGDGRPPLNCNSCHFNGGANTDPTFAFDNAVTPNHDLNDLANNGGSIPSHNRSFAPQVERLLDQAGDIIVQSSDDPSVNGNCYQQDLAEAPLTSYDIEGIESSGCDANPYDNGFLFSFDDSRSNERIASNRFNTQPVFESMDNPPFFHGHQINTIEGSVAFYATQRHLRNGEILPAIIPLNGSQVANIARFMRVMGADYNIESAITLLNKAVELNYEDRDINVKLAIAEIDDAIGLMAPVNLHISDALPMLRRAKNELSNTRRSRRGSNIVGALAALQSAQDSMLTRSATGNSTALLPRPIRTEVTHQQEQKTRELRERARR